jgi:outer membrane protein OmpA-like peptidoglycan-associated protein
MARTALLPPHPRGRLLLALCGLGLSGTAQAQAVSGFDAHGFHLAPYDGDPRDPLEVQRPGALHQWDWFLGGLFEYADSPLRFQPSDGGPSVAALDDLLALNLSTGVAVHERLRLNLGLPVYLTSKGLDEAPQSAGIGTFRVGGLLSILAPDDEDGGFGLGLAPWVDVPTGDPATFTGNQGLGGGAKLAFTVEGERVTFGGDVGAQFNQELDLLNLNGSDQLLAGLHLGVLLSETAGLNLEVVGEPPFEASIEPGTGFPAEAMLSLRKRSVAGVHFTLGGAAGLTPGVGAAAYRVFAGAGYGRIQTAPPRDTDGDGFVDKEDACPTEPETVNQYKDDDGCPDSLGRINVVTYLDGQPVDGAEVSLTSAENQRMLTTTAAGAGFDSMPGTAWAASATFDGCFAGSGKIEASDKVKELRIDLEPTRTGRVQYVVMDPEGNGIPNATVKYTAPYPQCAPEAPQALSADGMGVHTVGAGRQIIVVSAEDFGLFRAPIAVAEGGDERVEITLKPAKTKVEAKQIVILEMVYFELNKAVIMPQSFELLDEVATVLLANPQIKKVDVAGHTDSQGNDQYNLELSDARAKAVRDYLISKGVEGSRLQGTGYGESRPIDNNKTAAGRARNRRVEFNILETAQ